PRVLGGVARDQLGLGEGHVERRLGELGLGGDQEQQEADALGEDEGVADAVPAEDAALLLELDDALEAHGAGLDDHADHRQYQPWNPPGSMGPRRLCMWAMVFIRNT